MSDNAARILAGLFESRTGQKLAPGRQWRIDTALRPLIQARGFSSAEAFVLAIVNGRDKALADAAVEAMLNNETFFFRDHGAFRLLDEVALERLRAARTAKAVRRLRIWCAGCSTGQEAYTLAMLIGSQPTRWAGWTVEILGTDVSGAAIAQARQGIYSQMEIQRGLPVQQMMRWFEPDGERWRAQATLRRAVTFRTHNLIEAAPAPVGYDLVLCRNVLLYFGSDVRRLVFGRLAGAIAPDGVLMLGAGETVIGNTDDFVSDYESRGFYRLRLDRAAGALAQGR